MTGASSSSLMCSCVSHSACPQLPHRLTCWGGLHNKILAYGEPSLGLGMDQPPRGMHEGCTPLNSENLHQGNRPRVCEQRANARGSTRQYDTTPPERAWRQEQF